MNTARLWRQGRDQLAAWLPVLVMMLFALGSWWLVRSAPRFGPEGGGPPPSAEPDYFMREFSVRSFDADGRLKSEIVGSEGQHFPLTDTLEVQQPRIRSYDEQGNPTVATARRAVAKGEWVLLEVTTDFIPEATDPTGTSGVELTVSDRVSGASLVLMPTYGFSGGTE